MQTEITTYKTQIAELTDKYGNPSRIPSEETWRASEILRAHYILNVSPEHNAHTLKQYGVAEFAIREVCGDITIEQSRKVKRADKYAAVVDWCEQHALEQITPETIMEVGGFSYPTAIKFIGDRVDLFRKVKRGVYEVRDFKAERAAAS